jgi:hypothetical protein
LIAFLKKLFTDSQPNPAKDCDHGAFCFALGENDTPGWALCHLCDCYRIKYNTEEPLFEGSHHMRYKEWWIPKTPELERAVKTSPREFGELRIEKYLRRNGYLPR